MAKLYQPPGKPGTSVVTSPLKELEDDALPHNPLHVVMNGPVSSIGGLINRMRTKALTSAAAHEVFHDLVVTRLRAQADVLKLNGELVAAAKKIEALNAYTAHGIELSKKLSERLIQTMDVMEAIDWESFNAAEAEAQEKTAEIKRRHAAGEMNEAWVERALMRAEEARVAKTEFTTRIVSSFLAQLDQHVTMTLATIQKDPERYVKYL